MEKLKIKPALTCYEEDSIKDIAQKLKENSEKMIFVINNQKELVGVITTVDLVYKGILESKPKASDLMSSNVESVELSENIVKAIEIMNKYKSFICPVVENKKLKGVVTYDEIIKFIKENIKNVS